MNADPVCVRASRWISSTTILHNIHDLPKSNDDGRFQLKGSQRHARKISRRSQYFVEPYSVRRRLPRETTGTSVALQMGMTSAALDEYRTRVRAEYLEMPGLRLTAAQAQRLWQIDSASCRAILSGLTAAGFLVEAKGTYFRRAVMVSNIDPRLQSSTHKDR